MSLGQTAKLGFGTWSYGGVVFGAREIPGVEAAGNGSFLVIAQETVLSLALGGN